MSVGWFGRRAAIAATAALALPRGARAQAVYAIDNTQGRLEFIARHRGIFNSTGQFDRFRVRAQLLPGQTDRATVTVEVETASAAIAYPGGAALLRSAPFFDAEQFPTARFTGQVAPSGAPDRYAITGNLEVRGISRPVTMEGRIVSRRANPSGGEVAEITVNGEIRRSEFGMVAEQSVISDVIRIAFSVRMILGAPRAG